MYAYNCPVVQLQRAVITIDSSPSPMAADGSDAVSLREKPHKKPRGSIFSMSRRRISCKDLGHADCQGWLYKKKEKGAFLGNKWKKFWSVLKESALYWYTSQMAEKAEGFINLPEFTVDRALECKKKHALKISHPQRKTFYFAAENLEEMNKWLNKLGIAVIHRQPLAKNDDEYWSESEHDEPDVVAADGPPFPNLHQLEQQLPTSTTLLSEASCSSSSLDSLKFGSSHSLSRVDDQDRQLRRGTVNSSSAPVKVRPAVSCEGLSTPHSDKVTETYLVNSSVKSLNTVHSEVTQRHNGCTDQQHVPQDQTADVTPAQVQNVSTEDDEMQRLFKSLEQASLSPIGDRKPSTKRELRKSFIRRSKNPSVNDKLHKIRTLNSTLKCKEHDLAMINQLLEDHTLTAKKYREWKDTNTMLFHDIHQAQEPQDCCEGNNMGPNNTKARHQTEINT